jgi:hypothetical protein
MSVRRRQDRDRFYGNGRTPKAWHCTGCQMKHSGRVEQLRGPDGADYCQATYQDRVAAWQSKGSGTCLTATR